jgi:hypothetical protein
LQLLDFLVCDDIRHELGNKMTLVGIYGDQMQVMASPNPAEEKWPKRIKLAFFARIKVLKDEPMPDAFNLQFFQNEKEFNSVRQNLAIPTPPSNKPPKKITLLNLALVFGNFKLLAAGEINFKLTLLREGNVINDLSPEYVLKITMVPAQDMFQLKN